MKHKSRGALCPGSSVAIHNDFSPLCILRFFVTAASPKQWEGIAVLLDPGKGDIIDTFISYDQTNQKLRYLVILTIYNSSTPTVEHFEGIFDYDKVQTQVDGVLIFMCC